jgi:hypothetical protein
MSREDKKVPFVALNTGNLTAAAGITETILTPPAGKTAFLTTVVVTNMGAGDDNLQLFDEAAATPGTPAATLMPDIRVTNLSTVVVDLGELGIPVTTAISVQATAGAANILAYDVAVIGYYL